MRSSSSPMPPPPKMTGLSTPGSSGNSYRAAASPSPYTPSVTTASTPGAKTPSSTYRTLPPPQQQHSSSSSYEFHAPRTPEQRARLARIAALTTGPCSAPTTTVSRGDGGTMRGAGAGMTIGAAMRLNPQSSSSGEGGSMGGKDDNDGGGNGAENDDGDSPSVDVKRTLSATILSADRLALLIKNSASLRLALRASINISEDVVRRHADLLRHSGELSAAAERLQAEEALLTRRAEEIGMPLRHYDAVDRVGILVGVLFKEGGRTVVRGLARIQVDGEEFVPTLAEIDDAVEFFGAECGGADVYGRPGGGRTGGSHHGGHHHSAYSENASGSAEYYRRACALQDAALELLREGVADRVSQASVQVQDALDLHKRPLPADKLEASLAYTRFHGISKRSNALVAVARKRLDSLGCASVAAPPYEDLLTLCRNTYCGARETLLTFTVRAHMDALRERHGLVGMTRLASVFLIRLCTIETALYLDFFGDPDKRRHTRKRAKGALPLPGEETGDGDGGNPSAETEEGDDGGGEQNGEGGTDSKKQPPIKRAGSTSSHPAAAALASQVLSEDGTYRDTEFQSMLGGLCSALHRTVRRGLVSILDLDVLCQVVSVLREERSAANSSPTTLAAARAVSSVIQDAQERLIFCANMALHKEVVRFKPVPADLNYPGKLLGEEVGSGGDGAKKKVAIIIDDDESNDDEGKSEKEGAAAVPTPVTGEKKGESEETSSAAVVADQEGTKPPDDAVAAQLRVYDSWFPPMRSVLRILSKIFRVVEPRVFEDIALQSVQSCTKSLKDASVHILRKSGQIHGDLFLVKHLLILREQLSPFDIQLRSVERQLDFSEAGKAVSRFLANRNRRLFSMSTENALITLLREGVSVQESSVDSKRDLEDCLRSACNDFIEHTSTSLLGPIAVLVEQCKNAVGKVAASKAPFMNGTLVKQVFDKAVSNLDGELETMSKQMGLYLENAATQSILVKPVVRKLTRALDEARRFIGEVPDGENGWDAELRANVISLSEKFESNVKIGTSKQGARGVA